MALFKGYFICFQAGFNAIQTYLQKDLTDSPFGFHYAREVDLLNLALCNKTAK